MKKKLVSVLLATTLSVSLCIAGCGNNKQNTDSKKDTTTVETTEKKESVDHEKIKEYIEKADEIVIVKDAKNLDIEKAITSMVTEEQKENVESVVVDDSKVDYTKEGIYPLTITVTVKQESSDQTASTEESTEVPKKDAETSNVKNEADSKVDATESKDTSSTEEKNNAASTEVIEDTVDVTVAEKDKADDLLEDGSAVIGDDSKVEIKDEKKEENKKEDTKKEEESKKDDTSQKTDEKKEESVKKEDVKNDTATSNKQETAKKEDNASTTKPSGNSSSSSTSNNTSSSKPSGSSSSSNTTKPAGNTNSSTTKPTHTHTWVAQTKTVHHNEVGHNEQYIKKEAWDETISEPIYEMQEIPVGNQSGKEIDGDPNEYLLNNSNGDSGWHSEWKQVQTGTNTYTVHHDAEYGTRWVVDKAAYDETVTIGYKCSCGATK